MAQTAENSGTNSDGDAIKVRFSERMIHYTLSPTIAGGKNGVTSQAAGANNSVTAEQAAMNYKVTVIRSGATMLNQATWANLGGRAIFDTNDPTHKTVILLPPTASAASYTAGGPTAAADVVSGTFYYTDGTSGTFSTALAANTYADLDAKLDLLLTGGGSFTVTEITNTAGLGIVDAGDTYSITMSTGAMVGAKTVSNAVINMTGAFSNTKLNAMPNLFPGVAAGARADLYKPGDNVIVMADTTILDPAGNSVDSSGDDASANAS